MANYTKTQMIAIVKRSIFNRDDVDTEVGQALDGGQLKVAALRGVHHKNLEKLATFNTVASTRRYDFSAIFGSTDHAGCIGLFNPLRDTTNGREIRWRSVQYFDRLNQSTTGTPLFFAHWAAQIELHPTPSAVIAVQVRYRARPTRFSALDDGDSSGMDEEYDWPVVWFASSIANGLVGNLGRAQFYNKMAWDYLEGLGSAGDIEDEFVDFSLAADLSQGGR